MKRRRINMFTTNEAFQLLNRHVIKKEHFGQAPTIEHLGYVSGIITLNEEPEVVIKFIDELVQLTKLEFEDQIQVITDEKP